MDKPFVITGTRQELFNQIYTGLAKQSFQVARESVYHNCSYLLDDGRKCAVGQLLPADVALYIEDKCRGDSSIDEVVERGYIQCGPEVLEFLAKMQVLHDSRTKRGTLQERLVEYAVENGLDVPELSTVE